MFVTGKGVTAEVMSGTTTGKPPQFIGVYPQFDGSESNIMPAGANYFYIKNNMLYQYNPLTKQTELLEADAKSVTRGPKGYMVFSNSRNQVRPLVHLLSLLVLSLCRGRRGRLGQFSIQNCQFMTEEDPNPFVFQIIKLSLEDGTKEVLMTSSVAVDSIDLEFGDRPMTIVEEDDDEDDMDIGTEKETDSSTETGTDKDMDKDMDKDTDIETEKETDSGTDSGSNEGTDSGTDSGSNEGTDSGTDSGSNSNEGTDSGTDSGSNEGTDSGTDSGTDYNYSSIVMGMGKYIYYIVDGSLIKSNTEDPKDKTTINRVGGSNYLIEPKENTIYYLLFNSRVVKEKLGDGASARTIISGVGTVGSMILDPRKRVIYFSDVITGKIEKFDLNTSERTTVYSGLRVPKKLTFSNIRRSVESA